MLGRIQRDGIQPEPPAPRHIRRGSWLAIAAALALLAALWWLVAPSDNSLYAQALKALANAHTIHRTYKAIPSEGQAPQLVIESWCERNVGFRANMPDEISLGNQRHLWTYRKKDNLVFRSDSPNINELIDRELDLKRMLEDLKQLDFQRYPEGDAMAGGRRLTAYLLNHKGNVADPRTNDGKSRGVVLLDPQMRIVRTRQEVQSGGVWVPKVLIELEYDVPVDQALFEPDFGDNVKIVDATAAFDELTDLDKALYREERRGIIFAIHALKRFGNDRVLVVSSVRGSPEILKKYPLKPRSLGIGRYFTDGPATNLNISPQGDGYFRIDLAGVGYQGTDVCWWVLVPRGTNAPSYQAEPGKVMLPLGYTPVLWTDYGKTFIDERGIGQHVMWDALLELPAVPAPPTLDEIALGIYADMRTLGMPFRRLNMGLKPRTNESDIRSPDEVSADEYRAGAARNVSLWYERDLDFQLKGQFTEEMRRQAAGWAGKPTIHVRYNPLADDFTLAEIAKHTSIERLYLDGTRITDNGLRELAPLSNLQELSLNNTSITDVGLAHLAVLKALKSLDLHGTKVTPSGIAELIKAIPALKVNE